MACPEPGGVGAQQFGDAGRPAGGLGPLRPLGQLRNTFKALSDWGDNFERKHFDGDFLGAVADAPRVVGAKATKIGEELGTSTAKLVEEAMGVDDRLRLMTEGDDLAFDGVPSPSASSSSSMTAPGASAGGGGELWNAVRSDLQGLAAPASPPRTSSASVSLATAMVPEAASRPVPDAVGADHYPTARPRSATQGTASLWDEVQQLQVEVAKERDMRKGRVSAINSLEEAARRMRAELVDERQRMERAEETRWVAQNRSDSAERALEDLQDEHHTLLSEKATQEVDMRRHSVALVLADRQVKEASSSREGAWARDGPETEALKDAKIALAEVLSDMDEVRLEAKRETATLQRQLEAEQADRRQLQHTTDLYEAPPSFGASLKRLFKVARGADERCPQFQESGVR